MNLFLTYWILTTMYGVYWLVKHPSERHGDDMEHFTVMEILGHILPAALLSWMFVPIGILNSIKFKR
jgi:heme/copper-type cytochrome/quinol oxidase subunit 2